MKKTVAFAMSLLIAILSVGGYTVYGDELPFNDVKHTDWYYEYVNDVYERGIFNGVSESEFAPDSTLTRAMFVTALARVEKIDPSLYNWKVLGDVSPSDWYGPYVAWAYDKAITQSMGNDDFRPQYHVTREQIAVFITRYLKNCTDIELVSEKTDYPDKKDIADFAAYAVDICYGMGIMSGDENGNFMPKAPITRAQAATVISRLFDVIEKA